VGSWTDYVKYFSVSCFSVFTAFTYFLMTWEWNISFVVRLPAALILALFFEPADR